MGVIARIAFVNYVIVKNSVHKELERIVLVSSTVPVLNLVDLCQGCGARRWGLYNAVLYFRLLALGIV